MKFSGILCAVVALAATSASGFSLLGPYKPWMTETLSYRLPGDIGGPMTLGELYRWNLPTITYGFDQSFLNYFGEDGVRAVEEAFTILNELPPMSQIDPNVYPTNSKMVNAEAQALGYLDLKSYTLSLLLHQLGLNEPSRFTHALRTRQANVTATNYVVIRLNFNPFDLSPAPNVNGAEYGYQVVENPNPLRADALEFLNDPFARGWTAVADRELAGGEFFTGLTRDDVGGLHFLLRTNTVIVDRLPAPVTLVTPTTNAASAAAEWMPQPPAPITNVIETAARPGVDKLTFVRLPWDTNRQQFLALTNEFVDTYYTNGQRRQQTLQRVITQPDILCRARDLGVNIYDAPFPPGGGGYSFVPRYSAVSDTSRWINHDDLNGSTTMGGPGVIPPGATIDFGTVGRYSYLANSLGGSIYQWAAFDGSTNEPVAFLSETLNPSSTVTISARVRNDGQSPVLEWTLLGIPDRIYVIEGTTDFMRWASVTSVTNVSGDFVVTLPATAPRRFYRIGPRH